MLGTREHRRGRLHGRRLHAAGFIAVLTLILGLAIWSQMPVSARAAAPPASPREHSEKHGAAQHAEESAELKKIFDAPVDLYFDAAQLSSGKPGLAAVRFVDLVDVTGKALLRFEKGSERWVIDPDGVVGFHIAPAK